MSSCLIVLLPGVRPHEQLLAWCRDAGVSATVWDVDHGDEPPECPRFGGVLVIGGVTSPYDPRLPREALTCLLTRAAGRGVPTLGMGAGAHLLSWTLGGRPSMPATPAAAGLRKVNRTAHGRLDPLFGKAPAATEWIEWSHLSLTDLPVGSEVLAVDESGLPSAVRFGPHVWGLQGLPYLDREAVDAYLSSAEQCPAQVRDRLADAAARLDGVCASWQPLHRAFFDAVARHSGG